MIRRDRNRRIKFSALGLRISHSFPNGLHRFRSYKFSRVQIVESKIRGDRYNTSKFECILSLSRILSRNAKRVRSQFVVDEKARLEIRSAGQKESFRCDVQRKYFFSYRSLGPPPPPIDRCFTWRGAENARFSSLFSFAVAELMVSPRDTIEEIARGRIFIARAMTPLPAGAPHALPS